MKTLNATQAKNQFGQLLDDAQAEPVAIQKNGRNVAVLVSADEFQRISGAEAVRPEVKKSLDRSMKRWDKVYEALAK